MKGEVVNLHRAQWLALAGQAVDAASNLSEGRAKELGLQAGRMQAATPPASDAPRMMACLTFRWACQHFGAIDGTVRASLAPALTLYAQEIQRLFDAPSPRPANVAVVAEQVVLDLDPAWTRRADCGG